MKMKLAIYLAGSIKKSHEKSDESYWTPEDIDFLKKALDQCDVSFLNPAFRTDDLSDSISVFGRDMSQVFSCNVLFVDARDRRGLGVGAEMMWAKINRVAVLTWAPIETHYHKKTASILDVSVTDYVHPFVAALSDAVVENLAEGARWMQEVLPSAKIKGIESIHSAMKHYRETQLDRDLPMKQLLTANEALQKRWQRPLPQVTF